MRKIVLYILKILKFDFKLKHHYTGFNFLLNSYHHKGYWYYGSKREHSTIEKFFRIIQKGDYVIEIGGHIGYFSTLFSNIIGPDGKLDVFEPSGENLKYLKENISLMPTKLSRGVSIIEKGVGDQNIFLDFYIDPITGQNNSFVKDFDGFYENRKLSADKYVQLLTVSVPVITLDDYLQNNTKYPNFIKVDVEGFEYNVIVGAKGTIEKYKPNFMIEIQKDEKEIISYFLSVEYNIFNDNWVKISSWNDFLEFKTPNIFFINYSAL
jgi:FkbM family methyltransferase